MTMKALPPVDARTTNPHADRNELTNRLLKAAASASEPERRRLIDEAVLLNLGLAESIGKRYSGRGIERDDLAQVAYLGLHNAPRRLAPDSGKDRAPFAGPR